MKNLIANWNVRAEREPAYTLFVWNSLLEICVSIIESEENISIYVLWKYLKTRKISSALSVTLHDCNSDFDGVYWTGKTNTCYRNMTKNNVQTHLKYFGILRVGFFWYSRWKCIDTRIKNERENFKRRNIYAKHEYS